MAIRTVQFSTQLLGFIGAATAITNIVGTRYTYGRLVQLDNLPALTFQVIGVDRTETKEGGTDYDVIRVQFDCYDISGTVSGTANRCENLYDAVVATFDRFTDSDGTLEFHQTFFAGRTPMVEEFETKINSISVDFNFHVK